MKKPLSVIACLVLLTGCGTSSPESSKGGTPPQDRASFKVSDEASCTNLFSDDGGLVSEASVFLRDVSGIDDDTAAEAQTIADELDGVAQNASTRISDLLTIMQEPFLDLVAANKNGDSFNLDPARYKAAGFELASVCDGLTGNAGSQGGDEDTTALRISAEATCQLLVGPNEDGPLIEGVNFIVGLAQAGQEVTPTEVETSRNISEDLHAVLETANEDLRPYLQEVIKPFDVLGADGSTTFHVDMTTFKAAGVELLTKCA